MRNWSNCINQKGKGREGCVFTKRKQKQSGWVKKNNVFMKRILGSFLIIWIVCQKTFWQRDGYLLTKIFKWKKSPIVVDAQTLGPLSQDHGIHGIHLFMPCFFSLCQIIICMACSFQVISCNKPFFPFFWPFVICQILTRNLILIAVSGVPDFCTIFHFPPSVRPSQLFSIIWWFWPRKPYTFQKNSQNFAFSLLKSTPARKKYTTAGCGVVTNMSYVRRLCGFLFNIQQIQCLKLFWDIL